MVDVEGEMVPTIPEQRIWAVLFALTVLRQGSVLWFKLTAVLLPHLLRCWCYRHAPPCLAGVSSFLWSQRAPRYPRPAESSPQDWLPAHAAGGVHSRVLYWGQVCLKELMSCGIGSPQSSDGSCC